MIYTGPLFFEEHEQPYGFYRYTRFGLCHVFERAGFEVERLDWLEEFSEPPDTLFLPLRVSCLGTLAICQVRESSHGFFARSCAP